MTDEERLSLYEENEALTVWYANRHRGYINADTGFEWEDIISLAQIGLWQAAQTYRPPGRFSTWAASCMGSVIRDAARDADGLIRIPRTARERGESPCEVVQYPPEMGQEYEIDGYEDLVEAIAPFLKPHEWKWMAVLTESIETGGSMTSILQGMGRNAPSGLNCIGIMRRRLRRFCERGIFDDYI